MTEAVPALGVSGVSFGYGRRADGAAFAIRDIDFQVGAGEFTALLGVNGAGKTTLLAVVTRLFDAGSGSVKVCGFDMAKHPRDALARMGVVFQQATLDLDLTVRQNLSYAAGLRGLAKADYGPRIDMLLQRFALAERAGDKVRSLNGGHRRRVELARALLHRPRLLVLDEPTVGLDVPSRRALVEHVHALCREEGVAVLWATHLFDEILPEDRVVVLDRGRVVATGSVPEIKARADAPSLDRAFHALVGRNAA